MMSFFRPGNKENRMAHSDTNRLEAFSDGVFSIAITLLILEIKVPHGEEITQAGGLWPALSHHWASFLGYLTSFFTIGIMWANHHALFTYIRKVDRSFLLANLFLLMVIGFIPYPTAVLAEHLPRAETRTGALVFYEITLFLMTVAFNLVWLMGTRSRRLVAGEVDEQGMRTISRRYRFGPPGFLLAIGLALVSVWACIALNIVLAAFFALSEKKPAMRSQDPDARLGNRRLAETPEPSEVGGK
jgi:uncharacterized membrane protein